MSTDTDYRGQANLHLQYATRFIAAMRRGSDGEDDWGGNYGHAMQLAVVFHLGLAYRSHIADLMSQRKLEAFCEVAAEVLGMSPEIAEKVPELRELAERETQDDWLCRFLQFDFLCSPPGWADRRQQEDLLAMERSAGVSADDLDESLRQLHKLIERHRDFMYEY